MAHFYEEPSHTFSEYLLVPSYSSADCIPANVSLRTPLCRFRRGHLYSFERMYLSVHVSSHRSIDCWNRQIMPTE